MIATTTALIMLINTVRAKPLTESKYLDKVAMSRCVKANAFNHDYFWGIGADLQTRGYNYVGENLALNFNDTYSMFQALQASPTHKANNESPNYTLVGVGSCRNRVGNMTVIIFGSR